MKKKNLLMTAIAIFGLATITFGQTVPSYVPTSGLVGWWPFNGNANDESGNGNNGTVNGATLTSDRFGIFNNAYEFDGVDDYIVTNNISFANGGDYSISVWVNLSTAYSSGYPQHYIVANAATINGTYLNTDIDETQSGCYSVYSTNTLNNWHHYVGIKNGGNYTLYIDNVNIGTTSGCTTNFINGYPIFFGNSSINTEFTTGLIDDIGVWTRALTLQEITDLYNGCPLSVNIQPTNQTININNNAQFVVSSSEPSATYQWQTDLGVGYQNLNNVGQYSGTTNDTLTVSNVTISNNNQPFRCIVSSGSCSDTSNVAVLSVNNNVGINETSQDKLFSVFPNPAQSVINVKSDSKLIGSVYSIYDNSGRIVLTGKLNAENTIIELGNLSGGIYMFSVGENMKQTFKVIKE